MTDQNQIPGFPPGGLPAGTGTVTPPPGSQLQGKMMQALLSAAFDGCSCRACQQLREAGKELSGVLASGK